MAGTRAVGGGSAIGVVMLMTGMSVLAGGAGALFGMFVVGAEQKRATKAAANDPAHAAASVAKHGGGAKSNGHGATTASSGHAAKTATEKPGAMHFKSLAPVVVNLSGASKTWVRLEGAIAIEGEPGKEADHLAAQVTEDVVAFLRTVSIEQIAGPSGFQFLKDALDDRARVRSKGKVRELMIQGLIVE